MMCGCGWTGEVFRRVIDLSDLDTLEERMTTILGEIGGSVSGGTEDDGDGGGCYDRAILINNAGSLGHVGPSTDLSSLADLRAAVDLNVTGSVWLSSNFVKRFGDKDSCTRCSVVNISSLCAVEPFETMGTYCAGKAARDMFHAVLAKELELELEGGDSCGGADNTADNTAGSSNSVKILNYAPGVVDTPMTETLSQSDDLDDGLSSFYRGIAREGEGRMLTPSDTA